VGRPLHAIDCQGLFCETDKYCRQAAPELASARKRIKAWFTPTPEPIRLFFPPKWGINNKLPSQCSPTVSRPGQNKRPYPDLFLLVVTAVNARCQHRFSAQPGNDEK
jgi:hypothetical protein